MDADNQDDTRCPHCLAPMACTSSRRVGSLMERYRSCTGEGCEHTDKVYVREEIVRVLPVRKRTTAQPQCADAALD